MLCWYQTEARQLGRLREMVQIAGSLDLRLVVALFDFDQDIPVGRAILQVHLVLQPGTTAANDRHPEDAVGTSLLRQQA